MSTERPTDFAITVLDGARTIEVEELPPRSLEPALARRVRELFEAECREREAAGRGAELYNGTLFSLIDDPGQRLRGRFVGYSEWVAQLRDPSLRDELGIRPLGVTGAIVCADSVWLGLRSETTFLLPGLWELCPSGGVDLDARGADGRVDPRRQLALELEEELAWPAALIRSAVPFAFVEDREAAVVDIAYHLEIDGTADELRRAIEERENREYQRIEGIALEELEEFVDSGDRGPSSVAPVCVAMLEAGGWLPKRRG